MARTCAKWCSGSNWADLLRLNEDMPAQEMLEQLARIQDLLPG